MFRQRMGLLGTLAAMGAVGAAAGFTWRWAQRHRRASAAAPRDLSRWEGVTPIELLGGVRFPQIGELPYLLTLGGYGFYWIRLPETSGEEAPG